MDRRFSRSKTITVTPGIIRTKRGYCLRRSRFQQADTPALRADLERIVRETKWDGHEAVLRLKAAGFIVGRERKGDMVTVGRGTARIWLDIGDTVRYTEDPSDSDRELLLDVVEVLEGPLKRAWLKQKIIDRSQASS